MALPSKTISGTRIGTLTLGTRYCTPPRGPRRPSRIHHGLHLRISRWAGNIFVDHIYMHCFNLGTFLCDTNDVIVAMLVLENDEREQSYTKYDKVTYLSMKNMFAN